MQSIMSHPLLWSELFGEPAPWHYYCLFGFSSKPFGASLLQLRHRALLANLPFDGRYIEGAYGRATPTTVAVPPPGEALLASAPWHTAPSGRTLHKLHSSAQSPSRDRSEDV